MYYVILDAYLVMYFLCDMIYGYGCGSCVMQELHAIKSFEFCSFDCCMITQSFKYHPGKANVVTNALSQKLSGSLCYIRTVKMALLIELRNLDTKLKVDTCSGILAILKVRPLIMERILVARRIDEETKELCSDVKKGKVNELSCSEEGILKFGSRLYVPNVGELR